MEEVIKDERMMCLNYPHCFITSLQVSTQSTRSKDFSISSWWRISARKTALLLRLPRKLSEKNQLKIPLAEQFWLAVFEKFERVWKIEISESFREDFGKIVLLND